MHKLVDMVPLQNQLGEGGIYDWRTERLWWTDIEQKKLHSMSFPGGEIQSYETPERLCSFGLTRTEQEFICAFETGFALFNCATNYLQWIHQPAELRPGSGLRLNDGRVDPHGRFWCGSMVEDGARAGESMARLYCLGVDGALSRHRSGIEISNGICWSPSGAQFFFADSPKRCIQCFDFDINSGVFIIEKTTSDKTGCDNIFAQTADGAFPDGAITDAEGCLWSAHWGSSQVVRYSPEGEILESISLPTCQPTCVAFGGNEQNFLFVTSARQGLSTEQLAREPQAGSLFVYETSARGLPTPIYQIGSYGADSN